MFTYQPYPQTASAGLPPLTPPAAIHAMTTVEYLLAGFATIVLIGSWTLLTNILRAVEGYEDEFGFHFGLTPAIFAHYPMPAAPVAYKPADAARAEVPDAPQPRRNAGSKPPMLPVNLDAEDLHPRPNVKQTNQTSHTQAPFPTDLPPAP